MAGLGGGGNRFGRAQDEIEAEVGGLLGDFSAEDLDAAFGGGGYLDNGYSGEVADAAESQTGDPRRVGGAGYVQVGVNEFVPEYTGGIVSPEAQAFLDDKDYGYSGSAFTKDGVFHTGATDDWTVEAQPSTAETLMGLLFNPYSAISSAYKEATRKDAWGGVDPAGGNYFSDFDGAEDRDDTHAENMCVASGGTWDGGSCVMPSDGNGDNGANGDNGDNGGGYDPFASLNRLEWTHPMLGYGQDSYSGQRPDYIDESIWDYKPPQLTDWTQRLKTWGGV